MYSNLGHALGEIKAIRPGTEARTGGRFTQYPQELADRAMMEKRFSQSAATSASDGSADSALRKLSFSCEAADKVLTYWFDRELRSSLFVSLSMKRPSPGLVLKNRMQTVMVRRKTAWTRRRRFGEI